MITSDTATAITRTDPESSAVGIVVFSVEELVFSVVTRAGAVVSVSISVIRGIERCVTIIGLQYLIKVFSHA